MALSETTSLAAVKFSNLSVGRQVGLLVGLAASVALGVGLVLWSREPNYQPLYSNLNSRDAHEVVDVLRQNGVDFTINKRSGTIMVQSGEVHDARMKLASEGLPRGRGQGYEIFSKGNSFTTSQFMETAKYRHALETELSRTIAQFNNVKAARVHLAIPRQSSFVKADRKPSASVFLDVYAGVVLRTHTIASIVNLVASSVTDLGSDEVTVVDQNGQLLNEGGGSSLMAMTDRYYHYRQQLEQHYATKIRELLIPLLGPGRVKAKVSADIDFTSSEQTRETFNPDLPALRSVQSLEVNRSVGEEAAGTAGALSNQPPGPSRTEAGQAQGGESATTQATTGARDIKKQSTKNYELDKTISHTSQTPGRIKRLSVAVLVDNKAVFDAKTGKTDYKSLSEDEIKKIRLLVSDAVGLSSSRGDSINVINSAFAKPAPIEALPELSFWQQGWFYSLMKQVLGGLAVLLIMFGVLRPLLRNLANGSKADAAGNNQQQLMNPNDPMAQLGNQLQTHEGRMSAVQNMAENDPKRVAQVVKTWVDGG